MSAFSVVRPRVGCRKRRRPSELEQLVASLRRIATKQQKTMVVKQPRARRLASPTTTTPPTVTTTTNLEKKTKNREHPQFLEMKHVTSAPTHHHHHHHRVPALSLNEEIDAAAAAATSRAVWILVPLADDFTGKGQLAAAQIWVSLKRQTVLVLFRR